MLFPGDEYQSIRKYFDLQLINIGGRRGLDVAIGGAYSINVLSKDHESLSRASIGFDDREWQEWDENKRILSEIYRSEVKKGIFTLMDVNRLIAAIDTSEVE